VEQNGDDENAFPSRCESLINNHHHLLYACRRMPFPLVARDFFSRGIWKKLDPNKFVLVYNYDDEKNSGLEIKKTTLNKSKVVRAEYQGCYLFERVARNKTFMSYVAKVDVRGMIPSALANTGLKGVVGTVDRAVEYFEDQSFLRREQDDSTDTPRSHK